MTVDEDHFSPVANVNVNNTDLWALTKEMRNNTVGNDYEWHYHKILGTK